MSAQALQNRYSTIRFHSKHIHTPPYCRIKLHTCADSILTAWCNYDALVEFAIVTITLYICLFNLYLNLLIYVCTWSYLLLLLLLPLFFLTMTLIRHMDWYELELVLCILLIWFFFLRSCQHEIKRSNPIQSNPLALISLSRCYIARGQTTMNYTKKIVIFITMHIFS